MNIPSECRRCGSPLSTNGGDTENVRCVRCGQVNHPAELAGDGPEEMWLLRTKEGKVYGPVVRSVLDTWLSEGRVTADCDLRCNAEDWKSADMVYSQLIVTAEEIGNPFASESEIVEPKVRSLPLESSRGGLILGLGVLVILVPCPFLGGLAWMMGNADLRKMQLGGMDSQGLNFTRMGRVIGMVMTLFWLIIFAASIFWFLVNLITGFVL